MMTSLSTDHPAVQRAAQRLRKLTRKHRIARTGARHYEVISGRSGAVYDVDTQALTCNCEAGHLGRFCDHRLAALIFEQALQQVTSPASTPKPPRPRPVRPAHVPESLWNHLSSSDRRDVADGRMTFRPIPLSNRWNQYLDGYLIGTVRA